MNPTLHSILFGHGPFHFYLRFCFLSLALWVFVSGIGSAARGKRSVNITAALRQDVVLVAAVMLGFVVGWWAHAPQPTTEKVKQEIAMPGSNPGRPASGPPITEETSQ